MNRKKILITCLAASMTLSSISFAYADKANKNDKIQNGNQQKIITQIEKKDKSEIKVTKEIVKNKEGNITLYMEIPVIDGLTDVKFQDQINKTINQKAYDLMEEFQRETKLKSVSKSTEMEFYLEFEVKNSHGVLSIVLKNYQYTGGANGENLNYYYNIDIESNRTIQLSDLFKAESNYKLAINGEINRQIAEREKNGEKFDNFKTITNNHQFYIEGEDLVIVFPQYSIGPRTIGIPEFRIPLYQLNNYLKVPISRVEGSVYYNHKYNFQFKIAPIWEDKVYIVESYNNENLEAKIDFVYTPKDSNLMDYRLMSILVMDRDAYYKLSRDNKNNLGYVISETSEYVYIIETYGSNPYIYGSRAYNEYKELSVVIDGVDDLFKLNATKEESKEYKNVKDYKWVMINGKKENLNKDMYVTKNGTLMIPVAKVSKSLGYKVKWDPQKNAVTLDAGKTSTISIGKNQYAFSKALVFLEEEAVVINGTAFVPVSYFEKVLNLEVKINAEGMLTIERK